MNKRIIYLTGLPRSGSTLFCNLLAAHPEIDASPSSPLCHVIQNMRRQWSDDTFLLSQLDNNFEAVYNRLKRSTIAFINEWAQDSNKPVYVDKNRAWLTSIELLRHLQPDYKMIVCLRDLRAIFASIEKQHEKTLLLDFPDHVDSNVVDFRASSLFADTGVIGSSLKSLYNLEDLPAERLDHLFFLRYEDFLEKPAEVMKHLLNWLELSPHDYDFEKIEQLTQESDSHYRFKFPHKVKSSFEKPTTQSFGENISPRMAQTILGRFEWFYQRYYPEFKQDTQKSIDNRIQKALKD